MAEWNSITGISMKTVSSSQRGESEQSSANTEAAERRDGGETWEEMSPDLTRNDRSKQGKSGGPITISPTS